jgi:anti-sigma regulatory factor (Ser/Thr protein kinase)
VEPFERQPHLRFRFGHDRSSSRVARQILRPIARRGARADDVLLATSELVTNVVKHTDDGGELNAWLEPGGALLVEVHDTDPTLPTIIEPTAVGGRGLRILEALADEWGAAPTEAGKVVWARFQPRLSLVADT